MSRTAGRGLVTRCALPHPAAVSSPGWRGVCGGSDKPSKPISSICKGGQYAKQTKKQVVDCEETKQDPCGDKKGKEARHESREFTRDDCKKEKEITSCTESESESEGSDSEKMPTKKCAESEEMDEEKPRKLASDLCDCVKGAVAKAVESKAKEVARKQSGAKEPETPKKRKYVQDGGRRKIEKCKEKANKQGKGKHNSEDKETPKKVSEKENLETKKNEACARIKQALEKCKKGATDGGAKQAKPVDPKKPKKTEESKTTEKGEKPQATEKKPEPAKDCGKRKPSVVCK